MGKLHDLLYAIIDRVNKSVKTTVQSLSESEKTQARANIGAMPSTYVPPNQTAQQVGADPKGTAAEAVSEHNTSPTSHEDIRSVVTGLTERLNALANSDDTTLDQMKEVVEYIKDNRELIESVTTSKVNVTDIVNNLTTNVSNKPLSAAQGVILKGLIDTLSAEALRTSDVVNNLTSSSTTKPLSAYQGNMLRKMIESAGGGGGGGIALEGAKANQYPVIKAVDESGKPTEWEAADRTHWKEVIGKDAEVISERYIDFTGSTSTLTGLGANIFQDGYTYKVNWNGTEYTCKAYISDGIVHLGNGSLAGAPETADVPFCIVGSGITCMVFKDTETAQSVKLKVNGVAEVVYHKLDGRFLPEGSPYTESGRVEVLEPTGYTPEGGNNDLYVKRMLGLIGGETYIVNWNGAEYTCTANAFSQDGDTCVTIGYMPVGNEEENVNGYPFGVVDATIAGRVMTYVRTYDENPFTVSIYHDAETVHKLDHKYLPDGVPYVAGGGMVEILPECQPAADPEEGIFFIGSGVPDFEVGAKYTINWNGAEYTCECMDSASLGEAGGFVMGNVYALSGGQVGVNTGEPFVIIVFLGQMMIYPVDGATELTLSIYQGGAEIRKLDNRCLDLEWIPVKKQVDGDIQLESTISESSTVDGSKISFIPEPGKAYRVTYGGKSFVSTAKAYEDGASTFWYVGNMNVVYPATFADTGEPAAYYVSTISDNPMSAVFKTNDGASGDTAVKICEAVYAPEKLPEEFLPDTVATKAYVEELLGVIENGTY